MMNDECGMMNGRRLQRLLVAMCVLALLAAGAFAAEKPFFFVQIADTQLGFTLNNRDLSPEIANFEAAVKHINRLKPAFVVVSGDLVNAAHDPKQIRAWWQVAREIRQDVPLYLVPGNHDIGAVNEASIRSYEKLFGRDHYAFSYGNSRFVVLDSCLIHDAPDGFPLLDAQRKWFEDELSAARSADAKHIFVLTHHPWFLKTLDEADAYQNIPTARRRDYLDMMGKYGVDYALAGHLHSEASGQAGGASMIVTASLGKRLGNDPEGFRIVKVYPDRVEHAYYALDKVPESVRM